MVGDVGNSTGVGWIGFAGWHDVIGARYPLDANVIFAPALQSSIVGGQTGHVRENTVPGAARVLAQLAGNPRRAVETPAV